MNTQEENRIDPNINLSKFAIDVVKFYKLDKNCDWVRDILLELNENAQEREPEYYLDNSDISISLEIVKKYNPQIGEYLLVKGAITAHYITVCIRTLKEMPDNVEIDFKASFIDEAHAESPEYKDLTDVYLDQDVFELYFYEQRLAPLKEMLHEQLYLNINQYPVLDSETPLENISEKGKRLH